jgi:hypothetical protein
MKVLVCGGRDFKGADQVHRVLDTIHAKTPVALVIHGGQTGADTIADGWASQRGIQRLPFRVTVEEWRRLGPAAGPIRNRRMLKEGKPDLVVAFPGNRGTRDMVNQAKDARIQVMEVP